MSLDKKKVSPLVFAKQVRQELSRVSWPTRKEVVITSVLVFLMVLVFSSFFLVVDSLLAFAVKSILGWGAI